VHTEKDERSKQEGSERGSDVSLVFEGRGRRDVSKERKQGGKCLWQWHVAHPAGGKMGKSAKASKSPVLQKG